MELIYLYVERFNDFVVKQEITFSKDFIIELKDRVLTINSRENHLRNFYGNNIQNISMFVGKNGAGKTTLIDLLGMNRKDRLRNSTSSRHLRDEYFLLYYIEKDEMGHDLFGIEVLGENMLHNMFTNYVDNKEDESYDKSKGSIGKVYKYENGKFISTGRHFFDYKTEEESLSEKIQFEYIGESYRFSKRNQPYGIHNVRYDDYTARRRFVPNPTAHKKYLTLNKCINKEIKGFECDKAIIEFWDDIERDFTIEDEEFKKYETLVNEIKDKLYVWDTFYLHQAKVKDINITEKKEKYILDIYSRYILDMILHGLIPLCKDSKKLRKEAIVDIESCFDDILKFDAITSSYELLGRPNCCELELQRIIVLIDKMTQIHNANDILLVLGRYIGSRIHSKSECSEFGYITVLEDIIKHLTRIPDTCFNIGKVVMLVNGKNEKCIDDLLATYSMYEEMRDNEYYSDIGGKFRITFELLSEGEERFINTISKIDDCISRNKNVKLLVLLFDEPDQSLHPEWSRRFLDIITQVIDSIEFNGDLQLVLSTHSPYLLSDILPDDVFLFKRELKSRMLNISKLSEEKKSCLGANIYDMMQDEFFMDNTVGEFATKKINYYMKRINEINVESKDIDEIYYFIDKIGEPILQNVMKKKLEEKLFRIRITKEKKSILEMISNTDDRIRVQKYLQMIEEE